MTDTVVPTLPPQSTRPPDPVPGRFIRFMHWIRGVHDRDRMREHYANAGVWSSRIYAMVLPVLVLLAALLDVPPGIDGYIMAVWGLVTRAYIYYQGQAALAYDVVEEEHANRDLINSVMPLISIGILIAVWLLMLVLFYGEVANRTVNYGLLGWYFIAVALFDVLYDVTINNRFTFRLGKIPGRVEMREGH